MSNIVGCGNKTLTVSGVLGNSANPVRVFGYTQRSKASGAGVVQLFDGSDATGQERWKGTGNIDDGAIVIFPAEGKYFPVGCYVQLDANVAYVDFDYRQEN